MEDLLNIYLLHQKSISIPGLGTIYIERIPAHSDFVNKQLIPPSYHYRFDQYFDAPGKDFFAFISSRKNIPEYEAIKIYNEWALELRSGIGPNHPVMLQGIGSLIRDSSGSIAFEAVSPPSSYHMAVPAERVIRDNARHSMLVGDKETNTVDMSGYLQEVHKEKESWWIYALILAAASITAVFFHYYKNGAVMPFGNHQTIQVK